jgi:hypothetical protein
LAKLGLPPNAKALALRLSELRAQRVCHPVGEVEPRAEGWAVALHDGERAIGRLGGLAVGRRD